MNGELILSIYVFGSSARGSADDSSDRDVLIICNNRAIRDELRNEWINSGWSVAVYSPSRFAKMAMAGSLFVQHISLEGRIVKDKDNWLKYLLHSAVIKKSYANDALGSVFLAAPMERFSEDGMIKDNLLTADLAFSAVRNFGICHLAERRKLTFDYGEIVGHIGDEFDFSRSETQLLMSLRPGKVAYRQDRDFGLFQQTVGELRSLLSKLFVTRPLTQVHLHCPLRQLGSSYATIRDLEALVTVRLGKKPTKDELNSHGLSDIWQWVQNPREYSWHIRELSMRNVERLTLGGLPLRELELAEAE